MKVRCHEVGGWIGEMGVLSDGRLTTVASAVYKSGEEAVEGGDGVSYIGGDGGEGVASECCLRCDMVDGNVGEWLWSGVMT